MIICDLCEKEAYSYIVWGDKKEQQCNACKEHCEYIWKESLPLIQTGQLYWIQDKPKTEEEIKEYLS